MNLNGRDDAPGPSDLKEFGRSAMNTVLDRVGRGVSRMQEKTPLAHDLLESPDAYLVVFDAPGTTDGDLQVRFRRGAVEVRIDRFREFHEGFETRFPGRGLSLDGRAELPRDAAVDPDAASATLSERGTLRVRIPKAEESHTVAVEEESASGGESGSIDVGDDDEAAALSEGAGPDGDESPLSEDGADDAGTGDGDESPLSDGDEGDGRGSRAG